MMRFCRSFENEVRPFLEKQFPSFPREQTIIKPVVQLKYEWKEKTWYSGGPSGTWSYFQVGKRTQKRLKKEIRSME